jgi:hypothetical protein
MSWSYSGNPGSSPKDAVRFLIQDTIPSQPQLQDEEINWMLSLYNNAPMNAAIRACETLMAKYSRMVDQAVGQVKVSFSQRMKSYEQLLITLRNRLSIEDSAFYAGGINVTDKMLNAQNASLVKPDFTKHMMENHLQSTWSSQNQIGEWWWYGW